MGDRTGLLTFVNKQASRDGYGQAHGATNARLRVFPVENPVY